MPDYYKSKIISFTENMENEKIKKAKLILKTFPSLISDENETEEQFQKRWEKFESLTEAVKNKLSSKRTSDKIQQIGKFFNLELSALQFISRAVRNYYFGNLKIEDIPLILSKELAVDPARAKEILNQISNKIINDRSEEESYRTSLATFTLQEALKNYPELGEQLITSEKITLHNFPEPVRPSIKNWLAEYTFTLGPDKEKRGAVERSRYLFQNANARNLKNDDRQRLSYILRAYDENLPITVNKATRQVIFTAAAPGAPAAEVDRVPALKTRLDLEQDERTGVGVRFSSPQKLPYERKNSPNVPNIVRTEEKPKPLFKNVVNLKE